MRASRALFVSLLCLLWASVAVAQSKRTYYFSQNGGGYGVSCSSALAIGDGISTGASSTNYQQPGNTLVLCGTITGSAGSTAITFNASGTSGKPITVLFAHGARLQAPYWGSNGAINLNGHAYITIDGGAMGQIGGIAGNARNVNGFIENTANGSPGTTACPSGSCSYQEDSVGISDGSSSVSGTRNLTIRNLAVYDLYVRTSETDTSLPVGGTVAFNFNSLNLSDVLVTNCLIHDSATGIGLGYFGTVKNIEFSFNTIYNVNWGGYAGDGGYSVPGSSLNGFLFHDDWVYDFANWDSPSDTYHHDGFYAWDVHAGTGDALNNPVFYNNVLGPGWGMNVTAALWVDEEVAGTGATFFNNLVTGASTGGPRYGGGPPWGEAPGEGWIQADAESTAVSGSFNFYNNTAVVNDAQDAYGFISIPKSVSPNVTYNIYNNLFYDGWSVPGKHGVGTAFIAAFGMTGGTVNSNNNLYFDVGGWPTAITGESPFIYTKGNSPGYVTLSQWQAATGASNDSNDVTANPVFSTLPSIAQTSVNGGGYKGGYFQDTWSNPTAVGILSFRSPARGTGADLSSLGISYKANTNQDCTGVGTPLPLCTGVDAGPYDTGSLNNDMNYKPRGSNWSIGAIQTTGANPRFDTIVASAFPENGGSILPSDAQQVQFGADETFNITPVSGYTLSDVTADGISKGPLSFYTFFDVRQNHRISATFAATTYTITASAGTGGRISPSVTVDVNSGKNQAFLITPSVGYKISGVTVDGNSVGAVHRYTFSDVTANHTISAIFQRSSQ